MSAPNRAAESSVDERRAEEDANDELWARRSAAESDYRYMLLQSVVGLLADGLLPGRHLRAFVADLAAEAEQGFPMSRREGLRLHQLLAPALAPEMAWVRGQLGLSDAAGAEPEEAG